VARLGLVYLGHAGIHRSITIDVVAVIYHFMGDYSVIGLPSIFAVHADVAEYVAGIAGVCDGNA
jgi:hypothetical protein